MPHKGFFTQGLAILLRSSPSLRAIEERLGNFKIVDRVVTSAAWATGGPSLVVPYRPDVNGYVSIDVVEQRWPDRMGDPKADPEVFAAWVVGHFGPGACPGGLERACQHSGWTDGHSVPLQHQAFIRIRCSYLFGADADALLMPNDYQPLQELEFATDIAAALIRLPEVLCYFNPNGECVIDPRGFFESLNYHASAKLMPLELWSNVRLFRFQDAQPAWSLMDTVGMSQLDAPDHEACFQSDSYVPTEVGNFLRNASAYLVEHGPIIRSGDTMDGPANVKWQGFSIKQGRVEPPREVMRWFPQDQRRVPAELTDSIRTQASLPGGKHSS
jgi:Domain of unknown function (DUF4261)